MENKLNKEQLEDAFVDVRKAYRLLYSYQRRVMDLMTFIGIYFEFEPRNAHPFIGRDNQYILPQQSAWDELLYYNCPMWFKSSELKLDILAVLVSDTGLFDAFGADYQNNKTAIDKFYPVEKGSSRTELHLILKSEGRDWKEYKDDYIFSTKKSFEKVEDINGFLICKKYDLSDFMNEESTLELLKDFDNINDIENDENYDDFNGFAGFCRKNGIVLRPNK